MTDTPEIAGAKRRLEVQAAELPNWARQLLDYIARLEREVRDLRDRVSRHRCYNAQGGDCSVCGAAISDEHRVVEIPEGWTLVPDEPTPEMLNAGAKFSLTLRDAYVDMIGAAPVYQGSPSEVARPDALKEMEARKDAAYEERNRVVAALAWMALFMGWKAGIAHTAIEGWSADWHGCVYIDLPSGQVSWHFHDSHAAMFTYLPKYDGKWDGHSTEQKYLTLTALCSWRDRLIPKGGQPGVARRYWLIERGIPAEWLEMRPWAADAVAFGSSEQAARWTRDTSTARRFATRVEAEELIRCYPEITGSRVMEHVDCVGPRSEKPFREIAPGSPGISSAVWACNKCDEYTTHPEVHKCGSPSAGRKPSGYSRCRHWSLPVAGCSGRRGACSPQPRNTPSRRSKNCNRTSTSNPCRRTRSTPTCWGSSHQTRESRNELSPLHDDRPRAHTKCR